MSDKKPPPQEAKTTRPAAPRDWESKKRSGRMIILYSAPSDPFIRAKKKAAKKKAAKKKR